MPTYYVFNMAQIRELRRRELEKAFGSYNFVVVRKELFAHLRDPAVVIRNGNITFNTACINGLEDVVYVQLLLCEDEKKFAVKGWFTLGYMSVVYMLITEKEKNAKLLNTENN